VPARLGSAKHAAAEEGGVRKAASRTVLAAALIAVVPLCAAAAPSTMTTSPVVVRLLERYRAAVQDPGSPELTRYIVSGTLAGEGLTGTFRSVRDGERSRDDQQLGPRAEIVIGNGEQVYVRDSEGAVRQLTGVLLRRSRTERFIDDGTFAEHPERCVDRGSARLGERTVRVLDVTAPDGQTETLYLDDRTSLPARVAYDEDDGRTTIDLDDWRTVAGHRFAFHAVISNGDHAFDVTQVTTAVQVVATVPAGTFDVKPARKIDMPVPQTLPISERQNHLYVPVHINGETFDFLLDTGAASLLIDRHVANTLGLQQQGSFEASGANRTGGISVARLPDIEVGNGHLHDLVVSVVDLGGSTRGAFRIDGILGYPFFAQAMVRLDLAHHTMTFGPPGSLPVSGARIPLELDRSLPEATLRLNNLVDGQFVIDTGDSAEMLIYRPFLDRHPGVVPFTTMDRSSYGLGGATTSYRSTLDELNIGGVPLYHVSADVMLATSGAFADRFTSGNIGLGVLRNFVVTFDEANGAMYVEKSSQFDDGRDRYR